MKLLRKILPPEQWKFPVIIIMGIFVGIGAFVVKISKAPSYLSDKPETCMNCHVMAPQYATWNHSSHRERASCVDCHVPHNNVFNKYYFKAKDGTRHSYMFALRLEPQVIFIHEAGREVVHNNCVRCHEHLLTSDLRMANLPDFASHRTDRKCWECHRETPHGRVNSLSSVPYARVPVPESPVPAWMRRMLNETKKN
ncbi:MAG: cytochrome c nitrite reductase small subunit [Prolixibacteraceae bacterium]|nr:cytochrome c nitrite reductase small subunit [Prolixibacteraceae bacterium]